MNYDAILAEYMAAPEGAKPRWVDLARKYMSGDPSDQLELGRAGDRVRMHISRHRNDRAALSRTEQLASEHPYLKAKCDEHGLPIDRTHYYWAKVDGASIKIDIAKEEGPSWESRLEEHIAYTKQYAPVYPVIDRTKSEDGVLFIVDPADAHFGKLAMADETGDTYNLSVAERRFAEGIEGLIKKTQGYNIDQIVFVGGNDFLHTDTIDSRTTKGTPQDADSQWWHHYQIAKRAIIAGLERLLTVADVHFVHCPSNHDLTSGYFLADSLASWFSRNPNITFDTRPIHRKYFQYGANLIGATHGNGANESALPDLMKSEAKQAWAMSDHAYWLVHHIHHKDKSAYRGKKKVMLEKDYSDVTVLSTGKALVQNDYCHVEYLRSQSGTDAYHFVKGYVHGKRAMEGFLHDKVHGQIARITHLF